MKREVQYIWVEGDRTAKLEDYIISLREKIAPLAKTMDTLNKVASDLQSKLLHLEELRNNP
jgi:hypothetical protein